MIQEVKDAAKTTVERLSTTLDVLVKIVVIVGLPLFWAMNSRGVENSERSIKNETRIEEREKAIAASLNLIAGSLTDIREDIRELRLSRSHE